MRNHMRHSSVNALIFVPIYFYLTTQIAFRFGDSVCFSLLSAFIMYLTRLPVVVLFFSNSGRTFFIAVNVFQSLIAYRDEWTSRRRFKAHHTMTSSTQRINHILSRLMPPMVVEQIRSLGPDAPLPSHYYRFACIAQSDLVGFTKIACNRCPTEIIDLVSELFGLFDLLTDKFGVCKLETIGDAYIAGQADKPLTVENSPVSVVRFGMAMVTATADWAKDREMKVNCRVGVHSGECVGGIVGTEMQRYHLFGKFMGVLELLESTAPEGEVQVSAACMQAVQRFVRKEPNQAVGIDFVQREGAQLITSKGDEHALSDVGGRTYIARAGTAV
eukprot:CAMPEP_0180790800 /NCGR_PEP_ID=MMETSP1038_2-20121128/53448_1 /TAXON_ID=632150 /ORGANISM="Azadinium spinosum, Strain 3D9" /LENGTH=329 /DNA_ID=CAMNT_0022828855 /DNA_START=194 /DNA_END=1180 /DNA_ORIENTATION=-